MQISEPRWANRWPDGLVIALGTLGPLGRRLPAPGTFGSAAGVVYALPFVWAGNWVLTLGWSLLASWAAVALCGEAARRLGKEDPGEVVLDEFVVLPLVFLGAGTELLTDWPLWAVLLAGFGLFRIFDILKPLGISRLQELPGGWGIVADDFAAAIAAAVTLGGLAWVIRLF